jgi:hypothetical protein
VPVFAGEIERRFAVVFRRAWVRAVCEQRLRDLDVSIESRRVERSPASFGRRVDGRPVFEQGLDRGQILGSLRRDRAVQRRHLDELVPGDRGGIGARLEQRFGGFGVAEERGQVERLETVRRPGLDQSGVGGDELAHTVGATDARGLEDVEGRPFGEQRLGGRGSAFIESAEDG